ncbi:E3 ubiquitin-protein ligase UBR1-like [Sinocyclocheilus rhinocerous]|nr:PREDICTED: E3 ubiquitin-protein ligase UBR1-like [Sinocyclocheilus rhinocerous]
MTEESLVSQVYYYQDVKCRDEMFDKDVIMLLIAASKMDPNHFLMLVLLRFELFDIFNGNSSSKDQEVLKQWNRLTEEMLYLIIIIVGERYVPGISHVTKEDVTMREVIHLLCIQPMAHSSLVKSLPENESHETGLETVISKVAIFKKPGVSGHGLYELKKECLKEFNPFFYHYSRPQHSKAEEAQKKRRTQESSDKALRPPVPPPFCPAFSNIVYLLCCDIFIHILKRIFQKAAEDRSNRWTEPMIQRALHLVGQALLEEKTQLESSSTEEVTFDFSLKAQKSGSEHGKSLFHFLTRIKSLPSLKAQNDMIMWNLQMFEVVKCLREKSGPVASFSVDHSTLEESVQDKEKAERKRKAEAAKAHRQKIMAQMSAMQKNFIESNKMLYDNVPESSSQSDTAASVDSFRMDVDESRVAVGPQQGVCSTDWEAQICILCQEEQEVQAQAPAMVLTACVQRSTVLTQNRGKTLSPKVGSYPLFMPPDLAVGTHTGSCGHVMHATCWQKYFEAVQNTTRNRLHADLIIDLENGEYMCPLCKSLCNTVIPLIPVESSKLNYESAELVGQHLTLERWIQILSSRIRGLRGTWETDNNAEEAAEEATALFDESQAEFRSILSFGVQEPPKFSRSITEMLGVCATTVHRVGLQTAPNDLCPYMPVMSWNTCAYTIQAIENMLQEEGKPLFGSLQNRQLSGIKALVQFSAAQRLKSSQAVIQKHFADMLAVLVPVPNVENTPSILEVDFFHLLVGLVLSIPALYQEEAVDLQPSAVSTAYNHLYLLHLLTMTHMLQVLLASHDCAVIGGPGEGDEAQAAAELFSIVSQHTDRLRAGVTGFCVEGVKRGVLPFLRCAALFFNCLTGVPPPEELSGTAESPESQLHLLCSYLSLPSNLFQLFQDHRDVVTTLIKRWCENTAISKALKGEMQIIRYPHKRNRLIDLPEDYSVLLNQASHFKCPNSSDDERKHPTLCLLCGVMLCAQSPCCQEQLNGEEVGACTAHAAICGAGVGMFLRVRECEIILMASKTRGSPYPAPYLDDYGETDPQLGRGNPLHLYPERYRKLFHMWQQHCVLEEIARSLELLNVMFPFEWQML